MRRRIAAALTLALFAGAAAGSVAATRHQSYGRALDRVLAKLERDRRDGLEPGTVARLRAELPTTPAWFSPAWVGGGPAGSVDRVDAEIDSAWADAVTAQRRAVDSVIAATAQLASEQGAPPELPQTVARWQVEERAATTPGELARLAQADGAVLAQDRAEVQRAQAEVAAQLRDAGGPRGLLRAASRADDTAESANLDASEVDAAAAALERDLDAGAPVDRSVFTLGQALQLFQVTLQLNGDLSGAILPAVSGADQAALEGTPAGAGLAAQAAALRQELSAARTRAQLSAVQQHLSTLRAAVDAELAGYRCGHPVGEGKVIVISLSLQQMVDYENGCAVQAAPVTTGRPALRTPAGQFHVFLKSSPWQMVSPWPKGSPFWYPSTWVSWVLEFAGGGFFLHDADWEDPGDYGPGSENNLSAASHGCIHIPTAVMRWLYDWAPVGTPVIVQD